MLLRTREPGDLEGCVAMLRRVHEVSGYPSNWPHDPGRWLTPAGQVTALVAEDNDQLAGHVGLVQGVRTPCLLRVTGPDAKQLGGITRLFVNPAARRQGVGRALLDAAAAEARARGLRPVLDVVEDDKPAIALYEWSDWELAGTATATWVTLDGVTPTLRCYVGPLRPTRTSR